MSDRSLHGVRGRATRLYRPFIVLVLLAMFVAPSIAAAQPAEQPAAQSGVYVVQRGDTLSEIAARFGVSVSAIARANGLADTDFVWWGQRLVIPGAATSAPASSGGGTYVVQRGDTLAKIAARYGVSMSAIASANGLSNTNFVWVGQRLVIPGASTKSQAGGGSSVPVMPGGTYVVQRGDTLAKIAARYGTTINALMSLNGLTNANRIYVGQRLRLSGAASKSKAPAAGGGAPAVAPRATGERWIDVNLSRQRLTAYQGQKPVFSAAVSTGLARTPTVVGTFKVYVKLTSTRMIGPGYNLPNVPYTMYFYSGYAIHGTYWHNNFGHPMSHGCINMRTEDAAWVFNFASVGTRVVTHY
jgi:LysM repeat protein